MNKSLMQFVCALMLSTLFVGMSACDKSPNGPESAAPDSPAAQASASGVEVYQAANSINQMDQMLSTQKNLTQINLPAVGSLSRMSQFLQGKAANFRSSFAAMKSSGGSGRVMGDSVLYDVTYTDLFGITHHDRVVYNTDTGKAAVYLVATYPTGFLGVRRDSTKIDVDVNFSLADSSDDVIEFIFNRKDFRSDRFLRYEEGSITPDPYLPGTEPTGGVLQGKKVFAAGQDSVEVTARLEFHAGLGGSWEKRVRFRSGALYEELITFTANGTGTFVTKFPGGRREEGTFDADGRDHRVSFTKTTTFPAGFDPRVVFESAAFTINPADSSWTGTFIGEWRFANGRVTRTETQISRTQVNGFDRLTITQINSNGTGGTLTLQAGATATTLDGSWTDEEGHYILVDGTINHDQSGTLHLRVYASKQAFDSGEQPIYEATLNFRPDGSGTGNITGGPNPGSFTFDANGQAHN